MYKKIESLLNQILPHTVEITTSNVVPEEDDSQTKLYTITYQGEVILCRLLKTFEGLPPEQVLEIALEFASGVGGHIIAKHTNGMEAIEMESLINALLPKGMKTTEVATQSLDDNGVMLEARTEANNSVIGFELELDHIIQLVHIAQESSGEIFGYLSRELTEDWIDTQLHS